MNLFKLFCREKGINLGTEAVRIDPPPAVVGIPCDECGSVYQRDKLRLCYTIDIRAGNNAGDKFGIRGVSIRTSLYCKDCFPQSDVQLVLYDDTYKVEDRHFSISQYQFLQEIDANADDGDSPELFSVGLEQYSRGNCYDCDEPNAQHDTCSSCRRKSKDK